MPEQDEHDLETLCRWCWNKMTMQDFVVVVDGEPHHLLRVGCDNRFCHRSAAMERNFA